MPTVPCSAPAHCRGRWCGDSGNHKPTLKQTGVHANIHAHACLSSTHTPPQVCTRTPHDSSAPPATLSPSLCAGPDSSSALAAAALPPPPSKSAGLGIRALGRARPPQNYGVPLWGHSTRALAAPQSPSCFMSHSRRAGSTASAPTLAAWKPQVPIQRLPGQSGLARQDSGPVDSTGPWPGLLTEGAVLLGAHGPPSPAAGEQGPAALLAGGLWGQGPAVFGYRQSRSLSCGFIPGAWLHLRADPTTAQPTGTQGPTGVLLWDRNSCSALGFVQRPPHPCRAHPAGMGSERPSPLSTARGSTVERASPAAVRAAWEGPVSSGQHRQDGPSAHRRRRGLAPRTPRPPLEDCSRHGTENREESVFRV